MHPLISALVAGITSIVLAYYMIFIPPLGIAFFSAAADFYIYWYAVAGFLPILIIGYAISRNHFVAPIVCWLFYYQIGVRWHELAIFAPALLTGSLLLFAVIFWWSRRRKR